MIGSAPIAGTPIAAALARAATEAAVGIIALFCGYQDAPAAVETPDSVIEQVLESPADDYIYSIVTDLPEDAPVYSYASNLVTLAAPELPAEPEEIPSALIADSEDADDLQDSILWIVYEDDATALTSWFPDEDDPLAAELEPAAVYFLFEDSSVADPVELLPPIIAEAADVDLLEDSYSWLLFEDVAAPDELPAELLAVVATDLSEPAAVWTYSAELLTAAAPVVEDSTDIPPAVFVDSVDLDAIEDSILWIVYEDDATALTVDLPDHADSEEEPLSVVEFLAFEDAPAVVFDYLPESVIVEAAEIESFEDSILWGVLDDVIGEIEDTANYRVIRVPIRNGVVYVRLHDRMLRAKRKHSSLVVI